MCDKLSVLVFANQNIGCEIVRFLASQPDANVAAVICYGTTLGPYWHADVKQVARQCGLPVIVYDKDSIREQLSHIGGIDLILPVAWRHRLGPEILAIPSIGGVNFHNSLLPRHRGMFANTWPLLLGESCGGVTLHWMTEDFDNGDVIAQRSFPIPSWHTAREVADRVHEEYVALFREMWPRAREWGFMSVKQGSDGAAYHTREDFFASNEIDLNSQLRIRDFLNFLRAKTYEPYYKNAFYRDPESGKKVYVAVLLVPEDEWARKNGSGKGVSRHALR